MDTAASLALGLHVFLLVLDPSIGHLQQRDKCEYVHISDWSECDLLSMTSSRNLELLSGDSKKCKKYKIENRDCNRNENRINNDVTLHHPNKSKKKRQKGKKIKAFHQPDCEYRKSKWSNCDLVQEYTQTQVQTLLPGSAAHCEPMVALTRPCATNLEMVEAEEESVVAGRRRGKKNRREEHRRRRKQKNQQESNKSKGDENISDVSLLADPELPAKIPAPAELRVEPHTTFVVISWQPPYHGSSGDHIPVDSYTVGYGQGFPDLHAVQVSGQEVTYKIDNLEPRKEYIVSLRANSALGVSEALYETVRTRSSSEGFMLLAPVSVRVQALSSEVLNVSWVDMNEEMASGRRRYYIRYRQLNHLSSLAASDHDFRTRQTADTYVLIKSLQPYTKYTCSVMVTDGERNSSWSVSAWGLTLEAAPSTPPEDLTIIQDPENYQHAVVSWQPPAKANGVITGYQVSYIPVVSKGEAQMWTQGVPGNDLSVTLTDLNPGTYNFSVRAKNSQGTGPPSFFRLYFIQGASSVMTLRASPVADDPKAVVLSWQMEKPYPRNIIGFVVLSTQNVSKEHTQWEVESRVRKNTQTALIENLQPATKYYFKVEAETSPSRVRLESDVVMFETPQAVIQSPVKPEVISPVESADEMMSPWQPDNRLSKTDNKSVSTLPQPAHVQVVIMSSNSALISWHDPGMADSEGTEKQPGPYTYRLRYRDVSRQSDYKFASLTLPSIFMVDLEPASKYEFSVRVHRGDQHSDWSSPVINTTFESAPSSSPSHVTVSMDDGDPTTAFLTWQPPQFPNGDITGYIVFYETVAERKSAVVPAGELSYRLPFLKPHTKYIFRIGARNSQGFSPLSNRVVYRTPRVIGTPPTDVTVIPAAEDIYSAVISWQPPSPSKRKIKLYTVTYYTEDGKQRRVLRVPGFTLTTVAKKLLPSTVYHFTVQAHYQRGRGPHSTTVKYSIPKELLSESL